MAVSGSRKPKTKDRKPFFRFFNMPEPSLTPEEKLLRIIESGPGKIPSAVPVARKVESVKFSLKTAHIRYGEKLKQLFNLRAVNIFLVSCAITFLTTL